MSSDDRKRMTRSPPPVTAGVMGLVVRAPPTACFHLLYTRDRAWLGLARGRGAARPGRASSSCVLVLGGATVSGVLGALMLQAGRDEGGGSLTVCTVPYRPHAPCGPPPPRPPPSPSPLCTHAPSPGSKALAQQQVQQQPLFSFSRVPGVFVFLFPPLSLVKGRPVRCLGV